MGASSALKLSGIIMRAIKNSGFSGEVYPVNPKHKTVAGLNAKSLSDIKKTLTWRFAMPAGVPCLSA